MFENGNQIQKSRDSGGINEKLYKTGLFSHFETKMEIIATHWH